jgi:alpha-L-fucosidase
MKSDGLHIHAMLAQRLQDNYKWAYPVVLRITHVKPASEPPQVLTVSSAASSAGSELLTGELTDMGGANELQVGFEYRSIAGDDVNARTAPWIPTPLQAVTQLGRFSYAVTDLPPGIYEFHAVVKHPLLTIFGADVRMQR